MAKRRQLEHFSEEELDRLLHGPALKGLDRVIRFDQPIPSPNPLKSVHLPPASDDVSSPGDTSAPDDTTTPAAVPSPEDKISLGDELSPNDITSPGDAMAKPGDYTAPSDISSPAAGIIPAVIVLSQAPSVRTSPGDASATSRNQAQRGSRPISFSQQRQFSANVPMYQDRDGAYVDPKRVRHATLVQHGHSPTEQLVYQTLWSQGGQGDGDAYRDVQIGYDRIAGHSGIQKRNIISIMHRLKEKLAIEVLQEQDSARNIARKYRVYGVAQILERRRKAGLEYVVRHKGVDFVFPQTPG